MRIVSTGEYNCMKGTLTLLVIFHFSSPGGRKKNYQGEMSMQHMQALYNKRS